MDTSQLLELALASGQSIDLRSNCERFLTALTSLLDLSYTSVWLRGELLTSDDEPAPGEGLGPPEQARLVLTYAQPWSRGDSKELPASHPLVEQINAERVVSMTATELAATGGIGTRARVDSGAFGGFQLEGLGLVAMHSLYRLVAFTDTELLELRSIVDSFAVSIEGCLAHRGLVREAARRRRAEVAVRHEKERFRALVENALDMILVLRFDGAVEYASDGARRMLGYDPHELVGRTVFELMHPDEVAARFQAFLEAARTPGSAPQQEMRLRHADESWRVVSAAINNLGSMASVGGIVMTCHDVTEQRRWVEQLERAQQRAEQASRLKDEFVALVSHELRTPLNGIVGMAGVLGRSPLNAEQQRHVGAIQRAADALGDVVNDILDLAKIERGKLELEPTPYDVERCVEDALDAVAILAARKGLELGYRVEPPVVERAVGDPRRVRQVLINLLSNAVKFTTEGEVWVVVRTGRTDSGDFELHLCVEDTGPGIPADKLSALFEPFTQLPQNGEDPGLPGTGLGLSICKNLVDAMGGRIWAESELGQGTVFNVALPCPVALATEEEHWAWARQRLAGLRVVALHPGGRGGDSLQRLARAWGIDLAMVATREAMSAAIVGGDPVAAVVVDDQLPLATGVAVMHEATVASGTTPLLVVLKSSRSGGDEQQPPLPAGARTVAKPLRPTRLAEELAAAVTAGSGAGDVDTEPREVTAESDRGRPLRVLVADDDDTNRDVARLVLTGLGHRVVEAADGATALRIALEGGIDVAFLDLQMPELDGTEVAVRIRHSGRVARLVAMTGSGASDLVDRCRDAGFDEVLVKPVEAATLEDVLNGLAAGMEKVTPPPEPIDQDQLARLQALMPGELLAELFDRFVSGAGGVMAELRDAATGRRVAEARRAAHALRGKALTVGATRLAEVCGEIEQQLHDSTRLDELVRGAGAELVRAAAALERALGAAVSLG